MLKYDTNSKAFVLNAYAKINLSLSVTSKRNDGYHNIETVYQSLDLCDVIKIKESNSFVINHIDGIDDCDRLEYKAYKAFFEYTKIKEFGIDINVEKHIPEKAGLGGGSSCSAQVILALNKMSKLNLDKEKLYEIGEKVGSDVPFFLSEYSTSYAFSKGEKLEKINSLPTYYVILVKGNKEKKSTKDAYNEIDSYSSEKVDYIDIVKYINDGQTDKAFNLCKNDFEKIYKDSNVDEIKKLLYVNGAKHTLLCGSGMHVFGLFDDYMKYNQTIDKLINTGLECILTKTQGGLL